ncbi:hypothetical protein JMJ35_003092 [Cladonia borealis]|uniref:protein S-acyltransferase n=1 Tax=Cladonia borealis TaxID=184061 RepID=A0AA39R637_9LECA|nr:hypothetical protein JMJ35_003092 [Cladonia borealis]
MSDPLSVGASVAGLISLGITVSQSLVDFYNSYKDLDSDLNGTVKRLESLLEIFNYLQETISNRKFQAEEQDLVNNIEASIGECRKLIHELQDEWEKLSKTSSGGVNTAVRLAGRRATYPFRKSTLQKIDEDIDEIRANLSSALGVLQLKDNNTIQTDVADIKTLLDLVKTNQISSHLCGWLKAPDATVDHNAACLKKHPGTGLWLTEDSRFANWLIEENSVLWLNGFAGSGKSVLCSTAIQSVLRHRRSDPRVGIAFFYFTFNDESKRGESGMLLALLLQLSTQLRDGHSDLVRLYNSYKTGTPSPRVLIEYLRVLIERFQHVYIMLDALDESPRDGPRGHVLDALETMREWALQGLHLFVTSRDERDIHEFFDLTTSQKVTMHNPGIDQDIANFISGRLNTDRSLQKWRKHREKIQDALARRAKGVFRWVECQLKSLHSCPCSQYHLDRLLNSLPQSLDETYERMLCKIDPALIKDARRILTLLCFASRPLTLPELIDGIAVETTEPTGLNKKCRLEDYNDIHDICPGFINLTVADEKLIVQIAHFSVQEYLESDRIKESQAKHFGLTSVKAHAEIAQICLIYLFEPKLSSSVLYWSALEEYPLAHFAAEYWYNHYESTVKPASNLDTLILSLFQQKESFMTWVRLYEGDEDYSHGTSDPSKAANPVYYAALLGLDQTLHELLNTKLQEEINAQGGFYGNALQAASYKGHKEVVQLLLDSGAYINAQGGHYSNALQAASYKGRKEVVQLLLDRGADVNAQSGPNGNALQAASCQGHENVVQLLLDKGADVNAQGGKYGNALQAASLEGRENVVQLLLDKGADVNAQSGGYYGNALQAASCQGHENVVQLLLDKGADVNAQSGGYYGNALQAASLKGRENVVQLLLDKGADVNAQSGGYYGNALQAASLEGRENVVQLLLDKGADVNAQSGGYYGNALQAASLKGHENVVQLLLDKGADVNAQSVGYYGNALQAASFKGHEKIVQQLLDRGADVNAQVGEYGNALQAASYIGHKKVVQLLLDRGADVNAQGRWYCNALEAASSSENVAARAEVVQLLRDRGAVSGWEDSWDEDSPVEDSSDEEGSDEDIPDED